MPFKTDFTTNPQAFLANHVTLLPGGNADGGGIPQGVEGTFYPTTETLPNGTVRNDYKKGYAFAGTKTVYWRETAANSGVVELVIGGTRRATEPGTAPTSETFAMYFLP